MAMNNFFLIGIADAVSRVPRCSWKTGKIVEFDFVLSWQKKYHCLSFVPKKFADCLQISVEGGQSSDVQANFIIDLYSSAQKDSF